MNRLFMFRRFGASSLKEIAKTIGMRHWPEATYQRLLKTIDPSVSYMGSGFVRQESDKRPDTEIRERMQREYTGFKYKLFKGSK